MGYLSGLGKVAAGSMALGLLKSFDLPEDSIAAPVKDSFQNAAEQFVYRTAGKETPFLAQRYGFAKGFSKINSYYTLTTTKNGKEIEVPLYASPEGEPDLTVNQAENLIKNLSEVPTGNSDVLNGILKQNYNAYQCALTGADNRYMNGDLKGREDLGTFWKEFSKTDLQNAHMFGKVETISQTSAGVVKKYTKPGMGLTFFANEIGNRAYDVMDALLYNPIEWVFGSEIARQAAVEGQFSAHMSTRTNLLSTLFGGRKPPVGRDSKKHYT